jgi:hypothetical protein
LNAAIPENAAIPDAPPPSPSDEGCGGSPSGAFVTVASGARW